MSAAALILAVLKSIPALEAIYVSTIDLYFKQQSATDNDNYDKKKAARDAIITAMMRPEVTNEELRDLRRSLYDLNH